MIGKRNTRRSGSSYELRRRSDMVIALGTGLVYDKEGREVGRGFMLEKMVKIDLD